MDGKRPDGKRPDGKRPDGKRLDGWCCSRAMPELKMLRYAHMYSSYRFVPGAIETHGVLGPQSLHFTKDLDRRL